MNPFDAMRAAASGGAADPPWMTQGKAMLKEWAESGWGFTANELLKTLPRPPSIACVGELIKWGEREGLIENVGSVMTAGDIGAPPRRETEWKGRIR